MSKLIQIDGQEGGGQMLRTALSLAMITGQPFRMTNIRGKRPKPGLMRQHLTCVRAAVEISDGTADGAEIGSTELVFRAGKVRGGEGTIISPSAPPAAPACCSRRCCPRCSMRTARARCGWKAARTTRWHRRSSS